MTLSALKSRYSEGNCQTENGVTLQKGLFFKLTKLLKFALRMMYAPRHNGWID
jgi:hypothetical protein